MGAPNIGWTFYYNYFRFLECIVGEDGEPEEVSFNGGPSMQVRKEALTTDLSWDDYSDLTEDKESANQPVLYPMGNHGFKLVTTYPGLLIGSGYQHQVGVKEEFELGFFFDYCSGLPVVPGSSIKGVLRSAFAENTDYVLVLIRELDQSVELSKDQLKELEQEIFGPETGETLERGVNSQDRFFDAFPVQSRYGNLLGEDNLTPHLGQGRTIFSDPVPLPFLKVMPGVVFYFDFELKNSEHFPKVTEEVKRKLFSEILCELGVGAKTNVGYGQFLKESDFETQYGSAKDGSTETRIVDDDGDAPFIPLEYQLQEAPGPFETLEMCGEIIEPSSGDQKKGKDTKRIKIFVSNELAFHLQAAKDVSLNQYQIGDWVKVTVQMNNNGSQIAKILDSEKIDK
ncbi:MAG: type III-B CRISPR module RAMP protein Cmr6 [Bdellovibrionales bacterium]|nr:type III-B CRISPR module RAMP protein Cmr6 [Bdellovibrionales bacterium]